MGLPARAPRERAVLRVGPSVTRLVSAVVGKVRVSVLVPVPDPLLVMVLVVAAPLLTEIRRALKPFRSKVAVPLVVAVAEPRTMEFVPWNAVSEPTISEPSVTVVRPVLVLTPPKVRVPVPVLVRMPAERPNPPGLETT